MRSSLVGVFKEISLPIVVEKIEEAERMVDFVTDIQWRPIQAHSSNLMLTEQRVDDISLFVYHSETASYAFRSVCSSCHHIVTFLSYKKTVKCLSCEREWHLGEQQGDLLDTLYPIKIKDHNWYVGLPVRSKKGFLF